jgi:hypothetical protein
MNPNEQGRKTIQHRKFLVKYFFEPVDGKWKDEAGEGDNVAKKFRCNVEHCRQILCQDQLNGVGNLITHLSKKHHII